MINNKNVQNVIEKLLTQEAVFQDGHWSSAHNFELAIKKLGFIPPVAISHQYKFPNGFDEESFERYVMQQIYIHMFDSDRITNPEKYIKKFFNGTTVPEQEQKQYLTELAKITGSLSNTEKESVIKYFLSLQPTALNNLARFLPELQQLNPEIRDIKFNNKSVFGFFDLYIGMTSRFHPKDIAYFCLLTDNEKAIKRQDEAISILGLGISPHFLMEPNRMRQLIDGIIVQKQNLIQHNFEK